MVSWAQGSRSHLSRAQAPPGPCQHSWSPGHQASGRDPEVKQRPEVPLPSSPRPPPSGPSGRAQPSLVPLPWLGTHPGSLLGLLCGWSQGIGAGGRANEQGEDSRVDPAARGSQGPSRRPSRLTQIAEAPGEEPLAAGGSRLLPPALLSPRLRACFSQPQAGSEAAAPPPPGASAGSSLPPMASKPSLLPQLTSVYGTTFNLPSASRRHLAVFSAFPDFNSLWFSRSKIPSLFVPRSFELLLVQNQSSQRTGVGGLPIFTFCRSYKDNSVKLLKTAHKSLCIALTWSMVGLNFGLVENSLNY